MSKILYLMSSGSKEVSYEPLLKHIPKPLSSCKVYLIKTAGDPEKDKTYLNSYEPALRSLGFRDIREYDLKGKNEDTLRKDLSDADIVFMCGGNTFYLLLHVRESGFGNVLRDLLHTGVIYIGSSAGSYICCPTIEMATWKHQDRNRVGMTDLTGLTLVPFLISAHYSERYESIIKEAASKTTIPLVVLTDDQAVLCIDDTYSIEGKGEKHTFHSPTFVREH